MFVITLYTHDLGSFITLSGSWSLPVYVYGKVMQLLGVEEDDGEVFPHVVKEQAVH